MPEPSAAAAAQPVIALIGTCDTKLRELVRLKHLLLEAGAARVLLIDGARSPVAHPDVDASRAATPDLVPTRLATELDGAGRSGALRIMAECVGAHIGGLFGRGEIHGALAAGGSGGTALAAPAMRDRLPIGFPKLIVSTVASGDTGPYVGESDITMMYSVVDIAGSNVLLDRIFSNAAGAMVGMARAWASSSLSLSPSRGAENPPAKKRIGITMFGVTTPCVDMAREYLESRFGCECYVFHATGHGGKSLERLVGDGQLDAVLDLTTTEIADHVAGGIMSAGPQRLEGALRAGIPCVLSVGATDMVNFGPRATVPEKYQGRQLFEHSPVVTLMRTTPEECRSVGLFIADKVKSHSTRPEQVRVLLPRGGVSMIATPGGPFADAEADAALCDTIVEALRGTEVGVVERAEEINSEKFAHAAAELLASMLSR